MVIAPQTDIQLNEPFTSGIFAQATTTGNAGTITINTPTLNVSNGAEISGSTQSGAAGGVTVNATNSITLSGPGGISAATGNGGTGGNLTLNAPQLTIQAGAAAAVSGTGTGTAGAIAVNANTVTVASGGQIASTTEAGDGNPAGIQLQNLQTLSVTNGLVSTSTATGTAGSVTVDASDSIVLSGQFAGGAAGISAAATGGGTAGSVTLNTNDFQVENGAAATVSSPNGEAGSLTVTANQVGLNQGFLTAVAGQGTGGANIAIDLSQDPALDNFLRLQNESLISASALGTASGGNISIDADFIFGDYPTGPNGSDIVANAELGDGGLIAIDALGIFGLQFRPVQTPLNDITASSEEGVQGTVVLNTLTTDPDSGLAELAFEFIDASDQTINRCDVGSSDEGSEITFAGSGGLPLMPTSVLRPTTANDTDWVALEDDLGENMSSSLVEDETLAAIAPYHHQPFLCHHSYRASQQRL